MLEGYLEQGPFYLLPPGQEPRVASNGISINGAQATVPLLFTPGGSLTFRGLLLDPSGRVDQHKAFLLFVLALALYTIAYPIK